jgi:acetyltransferase
MGRDQNDATQKRGKDNVEPGAVCAAGGTYPDQYEDHLHLAAVGAVTVRPIRAEDASLLESLFAGLSPRSIYLRYFSFLKLLTPATLKRFTQINYDQEIALVAIRQGAEGPKMLGVARIIQLVNESNAEFSVLVGDPWQGKGIGACLLQRCISIARERGIQQIFGMVMAANTQMLALGRKLKCTVQRLPESSDFLLTISLDKKAPGETT